MKQQRWSFVISAMCSVISLVMFFIGTYVCVVGGEIVKDIFIAIFSSSIFVTVLSLIGYITEKQRLIADIYKNCSFRDITSFYSVVDEDDNRVMHLARNGRNIFLTNMLNDLANVKYMMEEYYQGCFFRDQELKMLINEKLAPLYIDIAEVYHESVIKNISKVFSDKLNDLLMRYKDFSDKVGSWCNRKSKLLRNKKDHSQNK